MAGTYTIMVEGWPGRRPHRRPDRSIPGDLDAIVATFADDALVNDARQEFRGIKAIRAWAAKEIVGDHVTLSVTETVEHHGTTVVRAAYDGDYDKTNLPDPLIMTNYATVQNGKIVSLIVIRTVTAD